MPRVNGNFHKHFGEQNSGDFHWIKFQIDDSRRQDGSNLPTFQALSNKDRNTGVIDKSLIEIVKSLKPTQFVEIDYDLVAKPSEKFPDPFTNLVVRKISTMVASSVPAIEPDKYQTPVAQATPPPAPPKPVQERMDFSKPVEEPKTELVGDLPDFVKPEDVNQPDKPF